MKKPFQALEHKGVAIEQGKGFWPRFMEVQRPTGIGSIRYGSGLVNHLVNRKEEVP
jgi:hypothetical protein